MDNGTPIHEAAEPQEASGAALKERSKQLVQQSKDELHVEQSSRPRRGQLRGLLIEKGIVEHTTHSDLELKTEIGGGLHQARHELLKKSSADGSCVQVQGILIEKGQRHDNGDGGCDKLDELDEFAKLGLGSQPLIPSHIVAMTNYINEFAERLKPRPDDTDWEKFRSCIREVHQFHLNSSEQPTTRKASVMTDELIQIKQDIDKMVQPLNKLALQSQKLFSSIKGIQRKIIQLDLRVVHFRERFNANMSKREKSFENLMALSSMREGIDKDEMHEYKSLPLQGQSLEK